MSRIEHFARNAGVQGCVLSGVVGVLIGAGLMRDFREGNWAATLAVLFLTLGLPYFIRDRLVARATTVRNVMNGIALVCAVFVLLTPRPNCPEPIWLRAAVIAFLGAYMGVYFWLLSDRRVWIV